METSHLLGPTGNSAKQLVSSLHAYVLLGNQLPSFLLRLITISACHSAQTRYEQLSPVFHYSNNNLFMYTGLCGHHETWNMNHKNNTILLWQLLGYGILGCLHVLPWSYIHPTFLHNCQNFFLIFSTILLIELGCLTVGRAIRVRFI